MKANYSDQQSIIKKTYTETYTITSDHSHNSIPPINVYVRNYKNASAAITITVGKKTWTHHWPEIEEKNIQLLIASSDNEYIIKKLIGKKIKEIDFDKVQAAINKAGLHIEIKDQFDLAANISDICGTLGTDWPLNFPVRHTEEYNELNTIIDIIKKAFAYEIENFSKIENSKA